LAPSVPIGECGVGSDFRTAMLADKRRNSFGDALAGSILKLRNKRERRWL